MTVNVEKATQYFRYHKLADVWKEIMGQYAKENLLQQAESFLHNTLTLREGTESTSNFEHAVYEQAIHMLSFDKERYLLQNQGVNLYSYDGIQVQQGQSLHSPIAFQFLRKYICRKVGDIR